MNNIPKEILSFASSVELGDVSEKIGNQFGLHIDQIGELDAQIRHVLRGFSKAPDFTKDIMKYLEIDQSKANEITKAVNAEVFQVLRTKMQASNIAVPDEVLSASSGISAIEKAGGFSVEASKEDTSQETSGVGIERAERILDGIEHPVAGSEKISRKEAGVYSQYGQTQHVEPLVDHLLTGTVAQSQQKIVVSPPQPPAPKPTPPAPTKPDPYREIFK